MEKEEFQRLLNEDPEFKKKINKRMFIGFLIIVGLIAMISYCSREPSIPEKPWSSMTSKEREAFVTSKIDKRDIENATNLQIEFEHMIEKQFRDPSSVDFELAPSVYNGMAYVVEPDSAWIHLTFKGYAKNLFNANVPFSGMATIEYHPGDNTVSVKTWSMHE